MKFSRVLCVAICLAAVALVPRAAEAGKCWREARFQCVNGEPGHEYYIRYVQYDWTNDQGKHKDAALAKGATVCDASGNNGSQFKTIGFHAKEDACDKEIGLAYRIYKYKPSDLSGGGTLWKKIKRFFRQNNLNPVGGWAIYFAPRTKTHFYKTHTGNKTTPMPIPRP